MNKWQVVSLLTRGVKRKGILRLILGKGLGVQEGLFEEESLGNISERYNRAGVGVIVIGDKSYPKILAGVADPPVALFYKGDVDLLKKPSIAVVGSRDQSERGKEAVVRLVPELVREGFMIVSGLALGTDAQVHRVALGCGGMCVAVLPCGLDEVYPRQHQKLAEEIVKVGGCLVSEYPLGSKVEKYRFLERNRIIAGLAQATLIIEAGKPSGAIATANFALESGREVWVVEAKKGTKNSEGILNLIEDGAVVV